MPGGTIVAGPGRKRTAVPLRRRHAGRRCRGGPPGPGRRLEQPQPRAVPAVLLAHDADCRRAIAPQACRRAGAFPAHPVRLVGILGVEAVVVDPHEGHGESIHRHGRFGRDGRHGIARLGLDADQAAGVAAVLPAQDLLAFGARENGADGGDHVVVEPFAQPDLEAHQQALLRRRVLELRVDAAAHDPRRGARVDFARADGCAAVVRTSGQRGHRRRRKADGFRHAVAEPRLSALVDVDRLVQERDLGNAPLQGELARGQLVFDLQRQLAATRQRLQRIGRLGLERIADKIVQRRRLDLVQRVDQAHLDVNGHQAVRGLGAVQVDLARSARERAGKLAARDGEADVVAVADDGHGDAHQAAVGVDHRSAAVAGVQGPVDLHHGQIALVVHAQAGDGAFAHGDGRAARAGGQDAAEGKAEGVDRHGFRQLGFVEAIDRLGQVLDAADLDDGEVLFGIGRQDLAANRFLLLGAAGEDDGHGGILEGTHQESRRVAVVGRTYPSRRPGRVRPHGTGRPPMHRGEASAGNQDDFHDLGLDDVVIGDHVGAVALRLDDEARPADAAGQAHDFDLDEDRGRLDGRHRLRRDGLFRSGGNGQQRQRNE